MVWDHEVGGSNPPTPTSFKSITFPPFFLRNYAFYDFDIAMLLVSIRVPRTNAVGGRTA